MAGRLWPKEGVRGNVMELMKRGSLKIRAADQELEVI
jgi:hypothetical protein